MPNEMCHPHEKVVTARQCTHSSCLSVRGSQPPNVQQIKAFCESVSAWLSKQPQNMINVHCKAGKVSSYWRCIRVANALFITRTSPLKNDDTWTFDIE
eukprot:1182258-Prorocentrum_minimum.AAC.3